MYLSDRDIRTLLPALKITTADPAYPFEPDEQIQPCSIDLRVSNVFWLPRVRRTLPLKGRANTVDLRRSTIHDLDALRNWRQVTLREGQSIDLKPRQTVMCRIYERFTLPRDHAGKIEGRSSYARLGLAVHCTGDFINPGWGGFMPLQLTNYGPYRLRIPPYFAICQLMLLQLSSPPERAYGDDALDSKYMNDNGGPSVWWRDAHVRRLHSRLGQADLAEGIRQEIVSVVRFEDPEILDRFERYLDHSPVRAVSSTDEVLQTFTQREQRLKRFDRVAESAAPLLAGGAISCAVAELWVAAGALGLLLMVALCFVRNAWSRRESGYLGTKELRALRSRPNELSE